MSHFPRLCLVWLTACLLATGARAQESASVTVSAAWLRATVPQQSSTGAFMRLTSTRDARLVGVRSSVAGTVEIHQMAMDGQVMTMRAIDGIDLPAGKPVDFAAGGVHLMLRDLKHPLKEGEQVPMTLIVQDKQRRRSTIELNVPVKALTYAATPAH